MLDLKRIREEPEQIKKASAMKGDAADIDRILELDKIRRTVVAEADTLRGRINAASQQIGQKKKAW